MVKNVVNFQIGKFLTSCRSPRLGGEFDRERCRFPSRLDIEPSYKLWNGCL